MATYPPKFALVDQYGGAVYFGTKLGCERKLCRASDEGYTLEKLRKVSSGNAYSITVAGVEEHYEIIPYGELEEIRN